jgi:hypothetical protein
VNPASQLVANTRILDPIDLLNILTDDIVAMVNTHNWRHGMSFIPIIPEKNLEALVYFANKYHWRRQLKTLPVHWNAESMAAIKVRMQQVKAMKAEKTADSIEPGPIKVRAGYWNWVGQFRNKLQSTIGAADVPLIYVIREQHEEGWVARGRSKMCMQCILMVRNLPRIICLSTLCCTIIATMNALLVDVRP